MKTGFNDIASLTPFIEKWCFAIYRNELYIRRGKLYALSFKMIKLQCTSALASVFSF